ncbi:hypothetical protein MJD09_04770, partial [bacterium]|nr:hypothetical protein [bacterium]
MKKTSKLTILFTVLVVTGLAFWACQELDTTNFNAPDTDRALSTPEDVETLIRGSMTSFWAGITGSGMEHLSTMADALSYSWGNFGSREMSSEPRIAYPNRTDWNYRAALEAPWDDMYAAISAASDGLRQIRQGGLVIVDAARTHRADAFGKFVQGISMGVLAGYFDQAFILDENVDLSTDVLEMADYAAVNDAAIAMLEEAANLMETGPAF